MQTSQLLGSENKTPPVVNHGVGKGYWALVTVSALAAIALAVTGCHVTEVHDFMTQTVSMGSEFGGNVPIWHIFAAAGTLYGLGLVAYGVCKGTPAGSRRGSLEAASSEGPASQQQEGREEKKQAIEGNLEPSPREVPHDLD